MVANGKGSNGNQIVAINRIVSHPFATKVRGFHQNDIALIELTHNLEFDELVQPICLGDKVPEQGDMCIIAGVIKKGEGMKIYFYLNYIPKYLVQAVLYLIYVEDFFLIKEIRGTVLRIWKGLSHDFFK